jgi:hypothetical protein
MFIVAVSITVRNTYSTEYMYLEALDTLSVLIYIADC